MAAPGAAGVDRAGPARVSGGVPVVELAGYGERGAQVVGYEHGASWRLEVPVRNDSPVPLVVVGAQWASVARPLLAIGASERLALGPGESGTLRVSGTATDCRYYHERELAVLDRLRLDLEVLGRTASRQLRLDRPLLVHSPMIVGCPDRVLDRRAVNKP